MVQDQRISADVVRIDARKHQLGFHFDEGCVVQSEVSIKSATYALRTLVPIQ